MLNTTANAEPLRRAAATTDERRQILARLKGARAAIEHQLAQLQDPYLREVLRIDLALTDAQIAALEVELAETTIPLLERESQALQVSAYHTPTQPKLTLKLEIAKAQLADLHRKVRSLRH